MPKRVSDLPGRGRVMADDELLQGSRQAGAGGVMWTQISDPFGKGDKDGLGGIAIRSG
jgi:hypothetical protein